MQEKESKKILIIEDDEILCEFLKLYLSKHGYSVEYFHQGESLPKALVGSKVDLVIMDVILPEKDGIYWLKWVKSYYPATLVMMTSVRSGEDDRLLGLEAGARDYLIKPFRDKELLIRLNNILKNKYLPVMNQEPVMVGGLKIDFNNHVVKKDDDTVSHLTTLESDILKLLYLNAGSNISREEIALQVKGTSFHPLDRSIDIHINKLRKKIEDDPAKPIFIKTVRGKGYGFYATSID